MRVLVACEFSGVVRDAFAARGHDAWSCDLLPSERPGNHLRGDVCKWLAGKPGVCSTMPFQAWDIILGHPPCRYLCNSGVRWLAPGGQIDAERYQEMMAGADLFAAIFFAPCSRICLENPIMHKYANEYLQSAWHIKRSNRTQIVQPWMHGHGETKATCLWLKGLPTLQSSHTVPGRDARIHRMAPGPNRSKDRSRTYEGIAKAMAAQWG